MLQILILRFLSTKQGQIHSYGVRTAVRQMKRQKPDSASKVNLKSRDIENSSPHENQESLGARGKSCACWYSRLALGSTNLHQSFQWGLHKWRQAEMACGSMFVTGADGRQAQHDLLCINILLVSYCCYKQMNDVTLPPFSWVVLVFCTDIIFVKVPFPKSTQGKYWFVWEFGKVQGLLWAKRMLCLWHCVALQAVAWCYRKSICRAQSAGPKPLLQDDVKCWCPVSLCCWFSSIQKIRTVCACVTLPVPQS